MQLSVKFEVHLLPIELGKRTRETYYVVAELNTGTCGIGEASILPTENRDFRLQIAKQRAVMYALQNGVQTISDQLFFEYKDE